MSAVEFDNSVNEVAQQYLHLFQPLFLGMHDSVRIFLLILSSIQSIVFLGFLNFLHVIFCLERPTILIPPEEAFANMCFNSAQMDLPFAIFISVQNIECWFNKFIRVVSINLPSSKIYRKSKRCFTTISQRKLLS